MNQQINLYQPILRRERRLFSATAIFASLGAVLAGLLLISGAIAWGAARQEAELARLEAERDRFQARAMRLERQIVRPPDDSPLAAELDRLERELKAKQVFVRSVDPAALGSRTGFAAVLRGLARRPVEGLWLRELRLRGDGRLAFHGSAVHPTRVPRFVEGLASEPVFSGRAFETLRLERSADVPERIDFVLSTAGSAP